MARFARAQEVVTRARQNPLLSIPPQGIHGLDVAGGQFFERVVGRPVTREDYYGVHTTDSKSIAAVYAMGATYDDFFDDEYTERDPETGAYPVILSLNVSGLEVLPDVDALAQAAEWLDAPWMRNQFEGMSLDEANDSWEYQSELQIGDDVRASVINEVLQGGVVSAFDDEEEWEAWVEHGQYTPEVAIALVKQKRYLTDIGYDRLVQIEAMKPWWPRVLDDPWGGEIMEEYERIESIGYKAVTIDDFFHDDLLDLKVVAKGPAPARDVEYHGTSSINAQLAFPEVRLPSNPFPLKGQQLGFGFKKLKRRLLR